jgi:hypothetical protein
MPSQQVALRGQGGIDAVCDGVINERGHVLEVGILQRRAEHQLRATFILRNERRHEQFNLVDRDGHFEAKGGPLKAGLRAHAQALASHKIYLAWRLKMDPTAPRIRTQRIEI